MPDDLVSEATISDGPADACAHLLANASEASDSAPLMIMMHDRAANRLVEISWIPGRGMILHGTPLAGDIGMEVVSACVAGDQVMVADLSGAVAVIDRYAGSVSRVSTVAGPAVMPPDGRTLIAATDRGLLTIGLWTGDRQKPTLAAGIEPFALRSLDHPGSMLLVADDETDALTLVIGCYGALELATFSAKAPRNREPSPVEWRTVPLRSLAHDPILLSCPPLIVPAPDGPLVYATDDGATGLTAIDLRTGSVIPYPRNAGRYATLSAALPSIDSSACLVSEGDGTTHLWIPGSKPTPIDGAAGRPIAWTRERMLVMDRDRAILREVAAPAA